jgi:hypothetical protein
MHNSLFGHRSPDPPVPPGAVESKEKDRRSEQKATRRSVSVMLIAIASAVAEPAKMRSAVLNSTRF